MVVRNNYVSIIPKCSNDNLNQDKPSPDNDSSYCTLFMLTTLLLCGTIEKPLPLHHSFLSQ